MKLYSRPGNDLTDRFPLIVEALARLRSRSCIIDGEAVACDDSGIAQFNRIRYRSYDSTRVPLRLRPDRVERRRSAPRPAAGPQGHARVSRWPRLDPASASTSIWNATMARSSSATLARWGSKASCQKRKDFALPLGPLIRLAQDEEPGLRGCEARGRRGLGDGEARPSQTLVF